MIDKNLYTEPTEAFEYHATDGDWAEYNEWLNTVEQSEE